MVRDLDGHQQVLGRAEKAPTPERYVVSGRLKAARSRDQEKLRGVVLFVGDEDGTEWGVEANFEPRRVVLDGSGKYNLGDLRVAQVIPVGEI